MTSHFGFAASGRCPGPGAVWRPLLWVRGFGRVQGFGVIKGSGQGEP